MSCSAVHVAWYYICHQVICNLILAAAVQQIYMCRVTSFASIIIMITYYSNRSSTGVGVQISNVYINAGVLYMWTEHKGERLIDS